MCATKFEKFSKGRHLGVSIGNCIVLFPFTMCCFSKGIQTINSAGKFIGIVQLEESKLFGIIGSNDRNAKGDIAFTYCR